MVPPTPATERVFPSALPADYMEEAILADIAWREGNVAGTSAAGATSGMASAGGPSGAEELSAEIAMGADEYAQPRDTVDRMSYDDVLTDIELAIFQLTHLGNRPKLSNGAAA